MKEATTELENLDLEEDKIEETDITFTYEGESGIRLDLYLSQITEGMSRSYIQKLIKEGHVSVNEKTKDVKKHLLKAGDQVKLTLPPPERLTAEPENIPLEVVFEDEHVIVVNKKQGMVVHPAPGNYSGTLVNALMYHCKDQLSTINGVIRPGIVHRIDKDTSGLLMIAKSDLSHQKLAAELKAYKSERIYFALVQGEMKNASGTIKTLMGRSPNNRLKMAVTKEGREAITHYEAVKYFHGYTLVKCTLETGRTHQIRVHMQHLGYPIVGDPLYGPVHSKIKHEGQLLHASSLGFTHPLSGEFLTFKSELPDYFKKIIEKLEGEL